MPELDWREYLCFSCQNELAPTCFFASIAYSIAESTRSPEEKHKAIMEARQKIAEVRACPHKDSVDPYYEGRDSL